jgi:hypothetical protein
MSFSKLEGADAVKSTAWNVPGLQLGGFLFKIQFLNKTVNRLVFCLSLDFFCFIFFKKIKNKI